MSNKRKIEIRDMRDGRFLWLDKAALIYVTRHCGPSGVVVYAWLCYYANNNTQDAWPSIETIVKDSQLSRRTVIKMLGQLKKVSVIDIKKAKGKRGEHNVYTLLEIHPDLFETVQNMHRCKNSTGATQEAQKGATLYIEQYNKSNKIIKKQPASPPACGKLPYPEPTREELDNLKEKAAQIGPRFKVYAFMQKVKNAKGYPPPAAVMITICERFMAQREVANPWGFFMEWLKYDSPAFFADLNIRENRQYKKEPAAIGRILQEMRSGI